MGIAAFSHEAEAPLVIYPDAVLSGPGAFQGFDPIGGRHAHVIQSFGAVKLQHFAKHSALDVGGQTPRPFAFPNLLRLSASEILNHFDRAIT